MTEEQRKTVETIRGLMQSNRQWAVDTGGWIDNAEMLLEIIDDLQKQQPKRYTEGEIREACAVVFQMNENPSPVEKAFFESAVSNWLECARFLGMIKTEGGP